VTEDFMDAFENIWCSLRARWCDNHDLGGAHAFSHNLVKNGFFHRIVQVSVADDGVDRLIDDALRLYQEQHFDCMFTVSPKDRPEDFAEHLLRREFKEGIRSSAMIYDRPPDTPGVERMVQVRVIDRGEYDIWADVMCRSFEFAAEMGEVGRLALDSPDARCYLALVDGEPVGTTLLFSQSGMGYIDLVGTLPAHRRKSVASTLVMRAVKDSQALGNRWTSLESEAGGEIEGMYENLGFRSVYHRQRYTRPTSESPS
jgi:GNAT superfamily N-acetyltransferase